VTRRIRSPGRARNKPLKPLRAGMPGDPGEPSVTTLVCFTSPFAREAAGALGTRHSPRPLLGARFCAQPGRSRRGNAILCLYSSLRGALATKQSILSLRLDGLRRRFAPRNDDEILFWLFEN
jgi:hypothetical protein